MVKRKGVAKDSDMSRLCQRLTNKYKISRLSTGTVNLARQILEAMAIGKSSDGKYRSSNTHTVKWFISPHLRQPLRLSTVNERAMDKVDGNGIRGRCTVCLSLINQQLDM